MYPSRVPLRRLLPDWLRQLSDSLVWNRLSNMEYASAHADESPEAIFQLTGRVSPWYGDDGQSATGYRHFARSAISRSYEVAYRELGADDRGR